MIRKELRRYIPTFLQKPIKYLNVLSHPSFLLSCNSTTNEPLRPKVCTTHPLTIAETALKAETQQLTASLNLTPHAWLSTARAVDAVAPARITKAIGRENIIANPRIILSARVSSYLGGVQ
eukprot:gb/GECG01012497.1/.p1 GENE.gb/GECG01012497.1/~~gb/GECG01012497.1/.p1  ORF type:complete len:121 (+),score=4.82 gb/GECG01012497.1/:1-363(+)